MKINVLNKNTKNINIIDSSKLNGELHGHRSGRDFTKEEINTFNPVKKVEKVITKDVKPTK